MLRFCLCICFETIWVYILFLTNLEDEISIKGAEFVSPKISRIFFKKTNTIIIVLWKVGNEKRKL
jgi:hypothetical protein